MLLLQYLRQKRGKIERSCRIGLSPTKVEFLSDRTAHDRDYRTASMLDQCQNQTATRQLGRIIAAMLAMTGRVTMLGISRWTERGGSYRTVQRWFNTVLPWAQMSWLFFRTHLFQPDEVYLVVGDESVVSKAGKKTHGLGPFFLVDLQQAHRWGQLLHPFSGQCE